MLVPMAKVEIVGLHRQLEATLALLHSLGAVQLVDVAREGGAAPPRPYSLEDAQSARIDELRFLGARLDAVLRLTAEGAPGELPPAGGGDLEGDLDAARARLDALLPAIEGHQRRRDALGGEASTLPRHLQSVGRLLPLLADLTPLERFDSVALLVDARHVGVLELLREELEEVAGQRFDLLAARVDPDTFGAVIVIPRGDAERVHALLDRQRVSRVRLPEAYEGLPLRRALAAMEARLQELPGLIAGEERALHALLAPERCAWEAARREVRARLEQLSELHKLGTTRRVFLALAWTPTREVERVRRALAQAVGPEVDLREVELDPDQRRTAPVLLDNPPFARPFERLIRLYSLPRPDGYDPTVLTGVFLPLFFGLMLGDVAYGLALGVFALGLRRWGRGRSAVAEDLAAILSLSAASAVAFGALFGEVLGDLGHTALGLGPLWFDRAEAIGPLLLLSVGVGTAHVTLGLALGVWISWRAGLRREGVGKAARLVALAGLVALAAVGGGWLPRGGVAPAVGTIALGTAALAATEGALGLLLGPLEVLRLIGGVLSYLRIGALGLASVQLARTGNELGAAAPVGVGVVVAGALHALNFVLGVFSPTLQALRLHYVEFFGGFYLDGGVAFAPFGAAGGERPLAEAV